MNHYLRHLANFARIVEAGSMRAAAELLGTAPSGLSDSVRILENRLGAPLLMRHKSGVTPTSEGERVYASASEIVDLLDEALGASESKTLSGPCRISVPTEIAYTRFGVALAHLAKAHPEVQASLFAEDDIVDHHRFGRDYFLRLTGGAKDYDGLRKLWSGQVHAVLVASPSLLSPEAARDPDRVKAHPVIMGVGRRPPYDFTLKAPSTPQSTLTFERATFASHPSARLALAIQGLGVTGCLDVCARAAIDTGQLVEVLPEAFHRPVSAELFTPHKRPRRLDDPVVMATALALRTA